MVNPADRPATGREPTHCDHGMSAHGDDGCIHCECKVPGFRARATGEDAVEAEAAQGAAAPPDLDVERLSRAMLSRDFSTLHRCGNCYATEAEAIAAEYARLSGASTDSTEEPDADEA